MPDGPDPPQRGRQERLFAERADAPEGLTAEREAKRLGSPRTGPTGEHDPARRQGRARAEWRYSPFVPDAFPFRPIKKYSQTAHYGLDQTP